MKITKQQAMKDFKFLDKNLSDYAVDEDWLVNNIFHGLMHRNENITITDIIIGAINDIMYYCYDEGDSDDIKFLDNNKRVQRIKERYGFRKSYDEF